MAGIQTRGDWAKFLWPGLNDSFGREYDLHPNEYKEIFDQYTSDKDYEEDVGISPFGLASIKPETQSITYDKEQQSFVTRYPNVVYALGFVMSREVVSDDKYGKVGDRRTEGLAFSMGQTKEIVHANHLNRGFNATYPGGDGTELFSTVHPNYAGGTYANTLATAADLSQASLEQATIDIDLFEDDRGKKIAIKPMKLIVPPQLRHVAFRLLESALEPSTSNNAVNTVPGLFPNGFCVNHYLTNAKAFFIKTSAKHGMKTFQRWEMEFAPDSDYDTHNKKFQANERYSSRWSDPRGMYGSAGV